MARIALTPMAATMARIGANGNGMPQCMVSLESMKPETPAMVIWANEICPV